MKMGVYIPSMGRSHRLFSVKSTVQFLDPSVKPVLVVPTGEVGAYERAVRNHGRPDVEVLPCVVTGIAETRLAIGETARARKQSKFVMIDDDLNFCVRKSEAGFQLRPATIADTGDALAWVERALDDFAHASISPRQANNQMESGDVATLVKHNKRTLRLLAYQTKLFLKMEHGRVPVMEDFDVNLQLLRAGHQNVVSFWWAQDQRETGSAGGCSAYRTPETQDAAARKLQSLHPEFVKLRTKVNKSSVTKAAAALKERTEVTIQWERAWQSSQEKRR